MWFLPGPGWDVARWPLSTPSPRSTPAVTEAQLLRFAVWAAPGPSPPGSPLPRPCPGWALPGKGGCWRGPWPQASPQAVSASPQLAIPGAVPGAGVRAAGFSSALFPDSFRAVTVAGLPAPESRSVFCACSVAWGPACAQSRSGRPGASCLGGAGLWQGGAYLLLHQAFPAEAACTRLVPLRSSRLTALGSP